MIARRGVLHLHVLMAIHRRFCHPGTLLVNHLTTRKPLLVLFVLHLLFSVRFINQQDPLYNKKGGYVREQIHQGVRKLQTLIDSNQSIPTIPHLPLVLSIMPLVSQRKRRIRKPGGSKCKQLVRGIEGDKCNKMSIEHCTGQWSDRSASDGL